jgi:hypothetical protein
MAVRLSALCVGSPLPSRKIPGTPFCWRLSRPQGHSAAGRITSIEKSNDLTGNRTRDLPACRIVPQPTTLPRAHSTRAQETKFHIHTKQLSAHCGLSGLNTAGTDISEHQATSIFSVEQNISDLKHVHGGMNRNVGIHPQNYIVSQPTTSKQETSPPWKPQKLCGHKELLYIAVFGFSDKRPWVRSCTSNALHSGGAWFETRMG